MRAEIQLGHCFEWRYTIPRRASVPELYHDTPFCRDMPEVLATGYLVGMMELACLHGLMPLLTGRASRAWARWSSSATWRRRRRA